MNRLLSLLGLEARIRRIRIAAGESAMAIEDRTQLVRMAWEDEKHRLKRMLVLIVAVLGLTSVAVALVSVAVVVHFWDSPHRATAAWSVAGVWVALWAISVWGLVAALRSASGAFAPSRREFERDWAWVQDRLGIGNAGQPEGTPRPTRPGSREELLARIARQRQRIATLQAASEQAAPAQTPPPDETPSETALRVLRAHPVAAGVAAAAVIAVVKPRRLLRWAAFVAPVLWRMR